MNLIFRMSRVIVAMTLLAGPTGPVYAASAGAPASPNKGTPVLLGRGQRTDQVAQARAHAGLLNLPLYFEANHGQTDPSVKFFARAAGYNLYLTAAQAVMVLPRAKADKTNGAVVVRMKLKGANANPSVRGLDILPGHTNYILGNDRSKWRTGVEQYAKVKFSQVYPGIDMVYYGKQGHVEHDFIVAPGANPGRILIGFEGGKGLRLDGQGNLILSVEGGEVTYQAPTLYQMVGAKRAAVKGRFVLAGKRQVRFAVGDYIRSQSLVIDPALGYSSFLGGTVDDKGYAIAVDAAGNAYLTGSTVSTDFPNTAAHYQAVYTGGAISQVFVTKVNPAGSAVLWSTYLGGTGICIGKGIGVDGSSPPKVYVTGSTTHQADFPQTAALGTLGGTDAFVASLNGLGTVLNYSVVFGGPQVESGNGIAVDAAGNAYVTGVTGSMAALSFPYTFGGGAAYTVGAAQTAGGGATDAFVAKFSAAGVMQYSTYLGGTSDDHGNAIAIDGGGSAYVTGETGGVFVDGVAYPNVFKPTVTGAQDAFAAILDPTGATFVYKTYVGGSGIDEGTAIALDSSNDVYITGYTFSADFPGPGTDTNGVPYANTRVGVKQSTIGTAPDAFVFKLHPVNSGANDGKYSTFLGGSTDDRATGIAVDSAGNAYVTGTTTSGDFPSVSPISGGGTLVGSPEAFVTEVNPTAGDWVFSTYLGGTTDTYGQGIVLDSSKNAYVTGYTKSAAATFPLVTPFQAANAGSYDAFISKFGSFTPPICTITVTPSSGFSIGGDTVTITGTNFYGVFAPNAVTFDAVNASTYTVNGSSTAVTAVTPRHPLTGSLAVGAVTLKVTTTDGPCTASYQYVFTSGGGGGGCGDDFFFPSPATGVTGTFAYCMKGSGHAIIKVWNAIGDLAAKLDDNTSGCTPSAGTYACRSPLNTGRLAPGVYLYRVEKFYDSGTNDQSSVMKFAVKR